VNSKDPKQIGSSKIGDDGADDDADADVAGEIGIVDDVLCMSKLSHKQRQLTRGSSAMPTMRGLGLMESCRLALDIGYQTSKMQDLPRFGALDEVKPLLLLV
jgi:hypothetical protein